MKTNNPISPASQIRNLLIVFASGIGLAVLLSLVSLYYYNPSGSYLVKNVLLSPSSLESLRFVDGSSKAGGSPRFVFDEVEFSFYDNAQGKWGKKTVSPNQYSSLYSMINNEKSLEIVSTEVEKAFQKLPSSILALKVRTEGPSGWQLPAVIFTQVEFAAVGDYYRIQLRDQTNGLGSWVYFHQLGIYEKAFKILNP